MASASGSSNVQFASDGNAQTARALRSDVRSLSRPLAAGAFGMTSILESRDYLDGLMKNVERQAMRIANNAGAEVADSFVEFL